MLAASKYITKDMKDTNNEYLFDGYLSKFDKKDEANAPKKRG